jgi:ADP-ribose pyrophosphatase YjhB (NUDIX family)
MKESLAQWEGFVGLFGGHLGLDETPLDGVLREMDEEMVFNLSEKDLVYVDHFSEGESDITIYAFDMGVLDEDRLRLLASQCKEGIVFPILSETQFAGDVKWTFPKFGDAVNRARDKIRGLQG